ncbi:MAG: hypothetical protein KDE46_27115 [Caldilineaceae bacterium]|nr:hypothetical protein [Caldilineaceae bacterium]
MTIKVIGAGFGRTGTASLKVAVEKLGFSKCYHSESLGEHPEHKQIWFDLLAGKPINWDALFAGYQGAMGLPTTILYRELMNQYPKAKVILTMRDPERWYESASQTILQMPSGPQLAMMRVVSLFKPELKKVLPIIAVGRKIGMEYFFNNDLSKEHVIKRFHEHNEQVRQTVPPDKLLIYEVKEGWAPLCDFLNVPVPDEPFPRTNTREMFRSRLSK